MELIIPTLTTSNTLLLILLFILFVFIVILLVWKNIINKKQKTFNSDEYVVAIKTLHVMIDNYQQTILNPRITKLQQEHDTKTNANSKYAQDYNLIFKEASRDIMTNYLSKMMINVLISYFGKNGLLLYIITNLKGSDK